MASDTSLRQSQVPLLTLRRVDWPPCCRCCVRVGTLVAFLLGICYIWSCAETMLHLVLCKCAETMTEKISRQKGFLRRAIHIGWHQCVENNDLWSYSYIRRIHTKLDTVIPSALWLPCVGLHLEDDGAWQGSQETHLNLSIMEYISPPSWTHMLVSSIYAKFYYL